jgi:hypothetical protein
MTGDYTNNRILIGDGTDPKTDNNLEFESD